MGLYYVEVKNFRQKLETLSEVGSKFLKPW